MRFLANENVCGTVIRTLCRGGHDVLSAKQSMRGKSDPAILDERDMAMKSGKLWG